MKEHFIALDVHCEFCEMAAITHSGREVCRERCDTTIPALVAAIDSVRRPRVLTFEEGPLADWLSRNLRPHVDRLIVCEPRRNALIAKDGDKDDPIDVGKLAQLLRGGYLKEVHQSQSFDRSLVKQHVSFYHDRVRERVRQGHQLVAQFRRHGVFASINDIVDEEQGRQLWRRLPQRKTLLFDLQCLLEVYGLLYRQEEQFRAELIRLARREEPVRRFVALPGIGWVRALTFYVYVDAPARFSSKEKLWRYCGIGLERRHSGAGRCQVRLSKSGNRRLKDVLLGAAKSAVAAGDNPFADKYRYWNQQEGLHSSTARRNVARMIASAMRSLWLSGSAYEPERVRGAGRASSAA